MAYANIDKSLATLKEKEEMQNQQLFLLNSQLEQLSHSEQKLKEFLAV